jgi:beta-glucosidase
MTSPWLQRRALAMGALLVSGCRAPAPQGAAGPVPSRDVVCLAPSAPATDFYGDRDFPSAICRARASDLLAKMTLREKVAQMVQLAKDQIPNPDETAALSLGSILSGGGMGPRENSPLSWATMVHEYHRASLRSRLGVPILYGSDAVHGNGNVRGAVIFPHNVGLGAARDPDLVERVARATAEEVVATGVDWTFAPVVAPVRDERWGRTYEGFGEAPELAELLGPAAVRGFQGARLGRGPASVLACAKHFLGDGATKLGVDRGDDDLDESQIRSLLLPAYARAVEGQVGSIMVSYSSVRGVRMHCHGRLITDVLKRELGFNGFVVSDWEAIEQIPTSPDAAFAAALNGGIDMVMHPKMGARIIEAIERLVPEVVSQDRVDDAVRRILSIKCELGLFDPSRFELDGSGRIKPDAQRLGEVGSDAHRRVAREAVRRSIVLLKNGGGLLPLRKDLPTLLVTGPSADDLGRQCGGWTIKWQGEKGPITTGTTILEAVKRAVSPSTRVIGAPDEGASPGAAIVVIGETPYAETAGDRRDLALDTADVEVIKKAKATGAPVVVVLVTGRPLILGVVADLVDALVVAWLPGTEGSGIADVLFGDAAPTGRLPHSWPKSMTQIPINFGDARYEPLFAYGFGLTYAKNERSPSRR